MAMRCTPDTACLPSAGSRVGLGRLLVGFVLLAGGLASAGNEIPAGAVRPDQARHAAAPSALDRRVEALSKALGLDVEQKLQLYKILVSQREQVRQIWNDETRPSAYRIVATQTASNKAGDAIRAMLSEEQKQKYNLSQPPPEARVDSARPNVAQWMGALQHD
jgi:hypothetical protein